LPIDLPYKIKKNVPKVKGLKQKIIWVGNSEWGSRQGVIDHKGFESTILPLKELIIQHDNCVDLQIVDSRKKSIKNEEVLKLIRTSDLLLQVSKSEGTGMPLLEALGLATPVLSPDIGIAKEVLFGNYHFMLSSVDAESVHERIHELLRNDYASILSKSYKTYISLITKENLIRIKKSNIMPKYKSLNYRVKIRLYWLYRYLLKLTSKILLESSLISLRFVKMHPFKHLKLII
jgi:glycosyltransferase involved in cell wall biosynthesis